MQKILLFISCLFLSIALYSQPPQGINYQGVARDSLGHPLINQNVRIRLSILDSIVTGTVVYVETQTVTTNVAGLFNLSIGNGTVVTGSFSAVKWSKNNKWLKIEMDVTGGTNYLLLGTTQFLSVPYSLHARTAESLVSNPGGFSHYIGELFGGGIIYYLWKDGAGNEHGLIASLDDLSTGLVWQGGTGNTVTNATSPNDGAANTALIVSVLGASSTHAAGICNAYVNGIFTDWYLPSAMELDLIFNQAFLITTILNNDGNPLTNGLTLVDIATPNYWSSTENSSNGAWAQGAGNGGSQFIQGKGAGLRVRATRKF